MPTPSAIRHPGGGEMLVRMMGSGSAMSELRHGLTEGARTVREIAHRLANASTPGGRVATGAADPAAVAGTSDADATEGDLEAEMVRLADEQIRFEATANLLQKVHQQYRSAVRER